ncbi:MAG: M23 family metallopeptidase [Bdellovibrionales bacterium]|nr:M23 family metallopeptidase [Bdellovibrionales bacterium]
MADHGRRQGVEKRAGIGKGVAAWFAAFLFSSCGHISKVDPYQSGRAGLLDRLVTLKSAGMGLRPSRPTEAATGEDLDYVAKRANGWDWPLSRVAVTSTFGRREGRFHEGIDLKARVGTPVFAAEKGEVVYSGNRIGGYGRMVVIRHPGGLFSVYAHHSRNLVDEGQEVKRGQKIALSVKSGRASGPHLHFEVRRGARPVDPQEVLPRRHAASKLALFK